MKHLRFAALALTQLLVACGGTNTASTPPLTGPLEISGNIQNIGAVPATTITPTDFNSDPVGRPTGIGADGAFTLTIDPPVFSEPFDPVGECVGTAVNSLTISTSSSRTAAIYFSLTGGDAERMALQDAPTPDNTSFAQYWYVSEPVRAQGQVQCASGDFTPLRAYQFDLQQGWNLVLSELGKNSQGTIEAIEYTSYALDALPTFLEWYADDLY